MDEVLELCVRVLGNGPAAADAADAARGAQGGDRISELRAAVAACRAAAAAPRASHDPGEGAGLAVAVAHELEQATATLPVGQQEVLALRELLRLPYADIAAITGRRPDEVGWLLAEARLGLRDARRGPLPVPPSGRCAERERALSLLAARQDGEALAAGEDEWLHAHLMSCAECEIAHGAMLEASLCYRGWRAS